MADLKYEVIDRLGEGAMGAVYRARAKASGRIVALKVLVQRPDEEGMRRFERERRALAEADHPALVRVLDWGLGPDGCPYLAMPYVEGARTLAHWIEELWRDGTPADLHARARPLLAELCRALDHLHRRGVVHRDVKPQNVLVKPDGRPVVIDLGLAHLAGSQLTATGITLGTPAYSAPEQLRADPVSPRTDVYLIGLLIQEVTTGRRASGDFAKYVAAALDGRRPFPPPSHWNPALGAGMDELVRRATELDEAQRWPDAAALADALEALPAADWGGGGAPAPGNVTEVVRLEPGPSPAPRPMAPEERRPERGWLAGFALGGALAAIPVAALLAAPRGAGPLALEVEAGFHALAVRAETAAPCVGRLGVRVDGGPSRELVEPAPATRHRFLVDGLEAGTRYRFEFRTTSKDLEGEAEAVAPEPPRLLGAYALEAAGGPRVVIEVAGRVRGEVALSDASGASATLPLAAETDRHELAVPPATFHGPLTVRLRAVSALGETEDLSPATVSVPQRGN